MKTFSKGEASLATALETARQARRRRAMFEGGYIGDDQRQDSDLAAAPMPVDGPDRRRPSDGYVARSEAPATPESLPQKDELELACGGTVGYADGGEVEPPSFGRFASSMAPRYREGEARPMVEEERASFAAPEEDGEHDDMAEMARRLRRRRLYRGS